MNVDLASTIGAVAGLITVIGNFALQVMQIRGQRESREGRAVISDKVDVVAEKATIAAEKAEATATKIDENTKLTAEIHEATTAIATSTGAHPALKQPDDR